MPFAEDHHMIQVLASKRPEVIDLLGKFEAHVKLLKERRTWLEEQLLTRIEGQPPQ